MTDVTHQINSVRRQVGRRVREAGTAHTVTISQTYAADVDDVWDACTNPERIPRWFLPVSGDLRVNGHYQLQGNAGGTIERCDPPHSFAATWEYGDNTTWIEVRLSADPHGGTRFELEHIALADDAKWLEYGPGAVGVGWDMGLLGPGQLPRVRAARRPPGEHGLGRVGVGPAVHGAQQPALGRGKCRGVHGRRAGASRRRSHDRRLHGHRP